VRVEVLEAAEREAIRAARWYEVRRDGLGTDFVDAVEEALDAIASAPLSMITLVDGERVTLLDGGKRAGRDGTDEEGRR
jgi:hypothetical protein